MLTFPSTLLNKLTTGISTIFSRRLSLAMISPLTFFFGNLSLTSPISIVGLLAVYYSFIIGYTQVIFCYIGIACGQMLLYLSVYMGWATLLECWLQALPVLFLLSIFTCGYILKQPLEKTQIKSRFKGFENMLLFGFLTLANPMVFLESSRLLFITGDAAITFPIFAQIALSGFILNYSLNVFFLLGSDFLINTVPIYRPVSILRIIGTGIRMATISLLIYTFGRYPWRATYTYFFTPKKLYKPKPERKVGKSLSRLMPYRKVKLYMLKKRQSDPWTTIKQDRKNQYSDKRYKLRSLLPIINKVPYNLYSYNPGRFNSQMVIDHDTRVAKPMWLNGFVRVLYLYDRQSQPIEAEQRRDSFDSARYMLLKSSEGERNYDICHFGFYYPLLDTVSDYRPRSAMVTNAEYLFKSMHKPFKNTSSFPGRMYYPKYRTSKWGYRKATLERRKARKAEKLDKLRKSET